MSRVDTKQAEKAYLTRTGSSEWERIKPFSQPGADTLVDSARLLQDFSAAMLALQPEPADLILDLGAGGCWCSDLLRRLNRRSVAIDISWDMLRAGRSRPGGPALRAVAGDMERLPFLAGTFDKAVCLNALHHVPDMRAAVREIGRVLKPDGEVLFSEPGKGHADAPVATAAVRDFGVLEQEVLVPELIAACEEAGFHHVRLKPMSYSLPEFELTLPEWEAWTRAARSKRPMRALAKMWRAALEACGLGKQGSLFEDAFGITAVRVLRGAMEAHPVVVASKARSERETGPLYDARIVVQNAPDRVAAASSCAIRLQVANAGRATWRCRDDGAVGHVTVGVQLLDSERRLLARDHCRTRLPHDVPPGGTVALAFECPAPATPGAFHLKIDLVAEGVTWFEATGSRPVSRRLVVEGGSAA